MNTPYLNSKNFPAVDSASAVILATELETLLKEDYKGNMFALLGGYQRILADNRQHSRWPTIHRKLETLFKCGTDATVDGPMIGMSVSIRDSDYFRETAKLMGRTRSSLANIEWMASAWNMTFADTGLWMGKTFEPVSKAVVADKTDGDRATLEAYCPATSRIGRNYFREPGQPDPLQRLGLPALTALWGLKPRPLSTSEKGFDGQLTIENLEKEVNIPYSMTGGIFLAAPGRSVVPEMNEKAVYQLNYRWPKLGPTYPMTRLIDELVQIAEGIYLGQLVFATRHYSLGSLHFPDRPGIPGIPLGKAYAGEKEKTEGTLFDLFSGDRTVDYGYQNNGYFLMMDPAYAKAVYADSAFPQLRPRRGESGYRELGYDVSSPDRAGAAPGRAAGRWPEVTEWIDGWRDHTDLKEKFTTFLLEPDLPSSSVEAIQAMRRDGESILQMLQRIGREISEHTAGDDRLRHFEKFHRLFRAGVAPQVVDGLFQGHGRPGYNCRMDGTEPRDWYGQADVAHGFGYYHGANLNLHLGFRETLHGSGDSSFEENELFPGTLAGLLTGEPDAPPNVLDMVWHSIGKYIFPWAGKSFERISGRKLSMFLDESPDLAKRYPARVRELKTHLASAPHYALVKKAAGGHWKNPGVYAAHLENGSWDHGMSDADKAFWENEAATRWVDGNNIQDRRIIAADPLMRIIDMNYRIPDPSLQAISEAGPSPFARQGYIFLGTSDRESILPMNHSDGRRKKVFQFHYRYPMVGGPVPIGLCLDELVEIADGLFLGQLIYATALDVPYHSSVDPAEYKYQLFGYFLLLDDAWEYHRRAIGLDVWQTEFHLTA
ncbi:hypothetical protein DSCO28_28290 [Desulfosarcina ovata subsp. sediminis]|uniref:Uncharacterized protein n=1 Tax=Desulfosarcina ovata subsp. sediminis TaxID=885957 RepID=A0A5K7ZRN7_9BACT|nr:hypothetical protein [Desulfosarcina ovata]BBO82263.1 hypothetical protein DSCO28_28290 [Desulfosarcina ovata subsp. sediminis]